MGDRTCSVGDCDRPHFGLGYCRLHHSRLKRNGDLALRGPSKSADWVTPRCKVEDCDKAARSRGWCQTHYQRWHKRPDRSDPAEAKYNLGSESEQFWAKVSKDSPVPTYAPHLGPCWLWTGSPDGKGYGQFRLKQSKKGVRAHRYAYQAIVGPIPDGLELDHLCRVRLCVNPAHLEPVPRPINIQRALEARGAASVHGTTGKYARGCRCQPCRDAVAAYQRTYKARRANSA